MWRLRTHCMQSATRPKRPTPGRICSSGAGGSAAVGERAAGVVNSGRNHDVLGERRRRGNGLLSSRRPSMCNWTASYIRRSVSSRVSPVAIQPGRSVSTRRSSRHRAGEPLGPLLEPHHQFDPSAKLARLVPGAVPSAALARLAARPFRAVHLGRFRRNSGTSGHRGRRQQNETDYETSSHLPEPPCPPAARGRQRRVGAASHRTANVFNVSNGM